MTQPALIRRLIEDYTSRRPMRTTSLIVTFFGDALSQHGGSIWLGSLVKALALLGVNERLVRTSVFRLVKEGWLEAERIGRRSNYRFSDYGAHEYSRAARRIYALEDGQWQGQWQVLIPRDIPEQVKEQFRRSLHWQGYRPIATGTFAKPGDGGRILRETLEEFGIAEQVLLLDARTSDLSSGKLVRELVHDNWQLEQVAQRYRDFLANYRPLLRWVKAGKRPGPEAAFIARTLLIHDYRRVLLNDTPLPDELLPSAWPGAKALALTAQTYRALASPSVEYIMAELDSGEGPMPPPEALFTNRFRTVPGG